MALFQLSLQIVVVTPAIVNNALAEGKIQGLDAFTLMVFDECHHTDGEHAYNKIMSKYVDAKLKRRDPRPKLPQVGLISLRKIAQQDQDTHVI